MLAAKEGRKDDALLVYEDIKQIYHRMPEKYKEKVYSKVLPYVREFEKKSS